MAELVRSTVILSISSTCGSIRELSLLEILLGVVKAPKDFRLKGWFLQETESET